MKTLTNLAAVASIAAVHTGSVIFAQDAETVIPEIAICEAAPEVIACEPAPEIADCHDTYTPEVIACEPAPEIAVCPEPCIFPEPEIPEICVLPPPTGKPIEEPIDIDIHIDPGVEDTTGPVEGPTDTEFTDGGEGSVDENGVVDSGGPSEIPSEDVSTEGGDGESNENEVVDSSDPNADNEVTTTDDNDSVDFEKGVPIEWLKRGGSDGDSPNIYYYSMAGSPVEGNSGRVLEKEDAPNALASNSVSDNFAPSLNKEDAPNTIARGLGQEDKADAIKTKANTSSPKVLSEKNEPTALIKKGRVFLR